MAAKPTASTASDAPPAKTGPSMIVQIGALLVLTLLAAGAGWFSGGMMGAGQRPGGEQEAAEAPPAHGGGAQDHGDKDHGEAAGDDHGSAPSSLLVPLPQITTNLAAPSNVWLRMEVSLVLDEPQEAGLRDLVHQDLLAFVRTVRMHQIEGASGFQHFRDDLLERASIRSGGHVKQVLIQTLLVE